MPLSYVAKKLKMSGAHEVTRTPDRSLRKRALYPSELHGRERLAERKGFEPLGRVAVPIAFPRRRIRPLCHLSNMVVGVVRVELTTLYAQSRCATRLRYTPKMVAGEGFEPSTFGL